MNTQDPINSRDSELSEMNLPLIKPEDAKKLQSLGEMIDTISLKLKETQIKFSDLSRKQTYLILVFATINNYSEAIFTLCKSLRPEASMVILRSIVEAYINTAYLLSHCNDQRVLKFAFQDAFYSSGLMNEAIDFYERYPKLRPKAKEFSRKSLRGLRGISESLLASYSKSHNMDLSSHKQFKIENPELYDLLKRAQTVDRRFGNGSFEYQYLMVYRYFSEYAHLNMKGISHFFKPTENGYDATFSQSVDLSYIIETTYYFYLYFLEKLSQYKLIKTSIRPYQKKFKEFMNSKDFNPELKRE